MRIKEAITVVVFHNLLYIFVSSMIFTQTNKQYNISIYTKYKL